MLSEVSAVEELLRRTVDKASADLWANIRVITRQLPLW